MRDFYDERKWCPECKKYVRFMMSVDHSYCTSCGSRVRLFSSEDAKQFTDDVQKRKWRAS